MSRYLDRMNNPAFLRALDAIRLANVPPTLPTRCTCGRLHCWGCGLCLTAGTISVQQSAVAGLCRWCTHETVEEVPHVATA